jgi:hypothetical protein
MPTKAELEKLLDEREKQLATLDEDLKEQKNINQDLYEKAVQNASSPPEPDYTEKQEKIIERIDEIFENDPQLARNQNAMNVFEDFILDDKWLPMTRTEAKKMKDYWKSKMDWKHLSKQKKPRKAGEQVIRSRRHAYKSKGK